MVWEDQKSIHMILIHTLCNDDNFISALAQAKWMLLI